MNRFAPPLSDVGHVSRSYSLGNAGWLAAAIVAAYLLVIAVAYPQIIALFIERPGAVFFVHFAALTSLLLLLGLLLLLARFPSSVLLFACALVSSLLEFHNHFTVLPFVSVTATLCCLALSLKVFLARSRSVPGQT